MREVSRLVAAIIAASAGIAAAPPALVSNRSAYEVSLAHALPGGMAAVSGRTVVEFRDRCDGWETAERFLADMTDADGNVSRTDFVTTTWESKSGDSLRFDIVNMVDGQVVEREKGSATRNGDGSGEVMLTLPAERHFSLPAGTVFPIEQTMDVLEAAAAGKDSFASLAFQGGDESGLYFSTASIGKSVPAGAPSRDTPEGAAELLDETQAWPVLMSYFPNSAEGVTPDYEVASQLYANGLIGSMSLIYKRFTLNAKLTKVERLSAPPC